jgi:UDP-N-acetyl-2-amino-2-deoxyglucuronate dehydrogenase
MSVKFGIVGCGRIAKRHSDLLGGGQIEGASLVAVCDTDLEKARLIGERFNVPFYADAHHMMEHQELDALSILTESGNHARNVIELSRYRKHILVEKPMALTLDDADTMVKSCDEAGIKLFVVKQNRFNLPVVALKNAIDTGRFGKMVIGTVRVRWKRDDGYYKQAPWRGTWAMDGGVLANQAIHHIDMLQWMMGPVDTVFAKAETSLADIETEDVAVAVLKFQSGALGVIEATTAVRPNDLEGSISILGSGGSVVIGGFSVNKLITWDFVEELETDQEVREFANENPPDVYGFGHKAYYDHVVKSIRDGSPNLFDGFVGRSSLELLSAIYESIETGVEVPVRFVPKKCKLGVSDS